LREKIGRRADFALFARTRAAQAARGWGLMARGYGVEMPTWAAIVVTF